MAKVNYQYEKRQKEIQKKRKKDQKEKEKQNKKGMPAQVTPALPVTPSADAPAKLVEN